MATKTQPTVEDLLAPLGEKIAKYRYDERLSYPALATKAGVSVVLLSQIEKNQLDNISLKKLIYITQAIDQTVLITFK